MPKNSYNLITFSFAVVAKVSFMALKDCRFSLDLMRLRSNQYSSSYYLHGL